MGQRDKKAYFTDQYFHTIDDRGRVSIPSDFREILEKRAKGKVVLMMDDDKCIVVFPYDEWEKETGSRIKPYLPSDPRVEQREIDFRRWTMAGSKITEIDPHGRLLIPPSHRERAGINKEVAIIGGGFSFEIWDRERWKREVNEIEMRRNFIKKGEKDEESESNQ